MFTPKKMKVFDDYVIGLFFGEKYHFTQSEIKHTGGENEKNIRKLGNTQNSCVATDDLW